MTQYSDAVETISGFPVGDWRLFVDGNYMRYLRVFYRNENKKSFLHMNWAAFFGPGLWSFYRKLFLRGMILLLVQILLFVGLYAGSDVLFQERIAEAEWQKELTLPGYRQAEKMLNTKEPVMTPDIRAKIDAHHASNLALFRVQCGRFALWFVPQVLVHLVAGLTADCAYRRRCRRFLRARGEGSRSLCRKRKKAATGSAAMAEAAGVSVAMAVIYLFFLLLAVLVIRWSTPWVITLLTPLM